MRHYAKFRDTPILEEDTPTENTERKFFRRKSKPKCDEPGECVGELAAAIPKQRDPVTSWYWGTRPTIPSQSSANELHR